ADRRVLPSFPTRRSSDLPGAGVCGNSRGGGAACGARVLGVDDPMSGAWLAFLASALAIVVAGTALSRAADVIAEKSRLGGLWVGDRKSTRLNSSHVKISY